MNAAKPSPAEPGPFNGPYPSREEITRDRIMDGCIRALADHGLHGLKMKFIIETAGVSRQTLYNHYRNREEVIRDAFVREGIRISRGCAEAITRYEGIEDKFVYGMLWMYQQLPANPLLNQIVLHHEEFLAIVGLDQAIPLEQFGRLCFGEVLEEHPLLAAEFAEISELWSRAVLSFLLFEGEEKRSLAELEGFIRRRLVPGLGLGDAAASRAPTNQAQR